MNLNNYTIIKLHNMIIGINSYYIYLKYLILWIQFNAMRILEYLKLCRKPELPQYH